MNNPGQMKKLDKGGIVIIAQKDSKREIKRNVDMLIKMILNLLAD